MRNAARGPSRGLGPQVGNIRRLLPALPAAETEAVEVPLARSLGVVAADPTARVPAAPVRAVPVPAAPVLAARAVAALRGPRVRVAGSEVAAKWLLLAGPGAGLHRARRGPVRLGCPSYRERPKRCQHQWHRLRHRQPASVLPPAHRRDLPSQRLQTG